MEQRTSPCTWFSTCSIGVPPVADNAPALLRTAAFIVTVVLKHRHLHYITVLVRGVIARSTAK